VLSLAGGEWESCERPFPACNWSRLCSIADIIIGRLVPGKITFESTFALNIVVFLGSFVREVGGRTVLVLTYWSLLL
jgi:hypothetical protein